MRRKTTTIRDPFFEVTPRLAALSSSGSVADVAVVRERGGIQYSTADPHLVAPGDPDEQHTACNLRKLHVHLQGTGCSPANHNTAIQFLRSTHDAGWPTICLSYMWANYADAEKNRIFESLVAKSCQELLECYHADVCFGGSSTPITDVPTGASVVGRLAAILLFLHNTRPDSEGWSSFINPNMFEGKIEMSGKDLSRSINWDLVVLSGHSQGSGHAAYIAQKETLHRLSLFSGPQESCLVGDYGERHWLSKPFATTNIFAMMHADEEGSAELIPQCWRQMVSLRNAFEPDGIINIRSFSDASNGSIFGSIATALITHLEPEIGVEIARPNHNSVTLDAKIPMIHTSPQDEAISLVENFATPVYRLYVWPYLLGCS